MASVVRVGINDHRITYSAGWTTIYNYGGKGKTFTYSSTHHSELFFIFRGTSVRFYGRIGRGGGNLLFRLDGNTRSMSWNESNFYDGPTLLWSADNLGDADHQLYVHVYSLPQDGLFVADYLEVETLSGNAFDLLWAGPNATNVPKEAIVVDNFSPDIVYSTPSMWYRVHDVRYYRKSLSYTIQPGASLSFTFDGVAIWYYSNVDKSNGFYTVSIDYSKPERLHAKNTGGLLTQQMLWSKTDLSPGRHILKLRHDDLVTRKMGLDFFRVLRANDAYALPSSTPTSQALLAAVSAFGLLVLAIVFLGPFHPQRRRRRLLDTHAHHTPPAQGVQLSGALQESKSDPQLTRPPTCGATLSSGSPTATALTTTSIAIPESGMLPSQEPCESGPMEKISPSDG